MQPEVSEWESRLTLIAHAIAFCGFAVVMLTLWFGGGTADAHDAYLTLQARDDTSAAGRNPSDLGFL
ncbi:hypothetical protein [Streptomyces halstedii]|uniref:hypothetical protein n=1 Tax=Streptomyces halstedii TaxID=1944 RepID=UPI0013DB563B|nr:hypothetical protein [Streptomyces halstedii]